MVAIVLTLAIIAIKFSNKSGVPELLLFIILGIVFGVLGFEFDDYQFADNLATVSLMVIMFHGGFNTNWKMAKPVAKESIILSFFGTAATALITGFFCYKVLGFSYLEGMLIGSIVGSTDYSSVSNILRSRNLNLKYSSAPLLELESGSNDPTAYTMTMVFLSLLMGKNISVPLTILMQIVIGLGMGFLLAFLISRMIEFTRFDGDGLFIIFMVSAVLLTYSLADVIGGNGYLAVYVLGINMGNRQFKGKRDAIFFFDGLSNLMQIGLFFMLGLLSNPARFVANLPIATVIMFFMMIVSRPLAVFGLLLPFKRPKDQLLTISMAGIRGAAAIAFAIMAVNSGVDTQGDIFHIVFGVCVVSSLVQGSILAPFTKKLEMLDPSDTVLKTFNDYQDKSEIGFIQTKIFPGNRWIGRQVRDLSMAFDVIVAKIERRGHVVAPRGNTIIKQGDIVVLGGETHFDPSGHSLVEFTISDGHEYANRRLSSLSLPDNELIIMLQRADEGIVVPTGETLILPGDKLVKIVGDVLPDNILR